MTVALTKERSDEHDRHAELNAMLDMVERNINALIAAGGEAALTALRTRLENQGVLRQSVLPESATAAGTQPETLSELDMANLLALLRELRRSIHSSDLRSRLILHRERLTTVLKSRQGASHA